MAKQQRRSKRKKAAAKTPILPLPVDPSDVVPAIAGRVVALTCPPRPAPVVVAIETGKGKKRTEFVTSDERMLAVLTAAAATRGRVVAVYRQALEGQYVPKRLIHFLLSVQAEFPEAD